jgi:hypothetical protein
MVIVYLLIRFQRLGLYICSSASSEMKSMSILFRFSVLLAGMVGLHNADEMDLHEACTSKTRFQNGEDMGLFITLGFSTIFLRVMSQHYNDSFVSIKNTLSTFFVLRIKNRSANMTFSIKIKYRSRIPF